MVRRLDAAITAILLVFGLLGSGPAAVNQHKTVPPFGYVLIAAAVLPILLSRRWPLWTFLTSTGMTMLYLALGFPYGPIMFVLVVVSFSLAVRSPLRRTLLGVGSVLVVWAAIVGVGVLTGDRNWGEFLSVSAWLAIPAAAGIAVKARRDAASDVRSEQARRAVSEERLRLAQEVHDVAGHGFAVIAMQAGVALRLLKDVPVPDGVRAALDGIRSTSRESLDGLRAEIEAMQHDAPLRPSSGLGDLPSLADRMRASGLPVDLHCEPSLEVPSDVDQAAYRIVQESLTNVLRHAGADATARIEVQWVEQALRIEVSNTGRQTNGAAGRGITGMRSRAESLGGKLEAGPTAGGFVVRATLPVVR